MNYYIYKIHKFNLPCIWVLNYLGIQVIYHQSSLGKKYNFLKNCRQIDDYKCPDQWIECLELSYLDVNTFFKENGPIEGLVPYSTADMLTKRYEDLKCFQNLCLNDKDYQNNKSIICMPFYSHLKLFDSLSFTTNFFTYLDSLNETRVNLIDNLKHVFTILASLAHRVSDEDVRTIVSGVSQTEVPISRSSLNAFWLTDDEILPLSDTVYYFPSLKKISHKGARTINNISMCAELDFLARIKMLSIKIKLLLISIFCFNLEKNFILKNMFLVELWKNFYEIKKFKNYISNISELSPCGTHVETLHDLGVSTILWSYSYYGSRASIKKKFSGECLNLSFARFSHIFLWDQKLIDLFKSCEINFSNKRAKQYFISGPLANGSIKHFSYSQDVALEALQLELPKERILVSVFDLPAWKDSIRRDTGTGLFTTLKIQNSFYEGVYKLICSNRNIVALVKTKRKSTNVEMPFWFKKLVEHSRNGNVIILEESTSPILLIKASDIVLTTPFTSPSLIAENLGVKSFYFDPSSTFKFVSISESVISNEISESSLRKDRPEDSEYLFNERQFIKQLYEII